MRLTHAQQQVVSALGSVLDAAPTLTAVAEAVALAIQAAIGWDGYRFLAIDPDTLQIERLLAGTAHDADLRHAWLASTYFGRPNLFGFQERLALGVRAAAIHDDLARTFGMPASVRAGIDPNQWRRDTLDWTAGYFQGRPWAGGLHAAFPAQGRIVATMQAYRLRPATPFTATDVAFLRLITPTVGGILSAARQRDGHREADEDRSSSGIIVVDGTGAVRYASVAGETWLRRLTEIPVERQTVLPESLWAPVARIRRGDAVSRVQVGLAAGGATVEATPGGSDGSVALIVGPDRSPPPVTVPEAWSLTAAERRVVALAVTGLRNREIADRLSVSEHTVEWHLRQVFARIGVRSRGQLIAHHIASVSGGAGETGDRVATARRPV